MTDIAAFFRELHDRYGWNFSVFYDQWLGQKFVHGVELTIKLSVAGMFGAMVLGFACVLLRHSGSRLLGGFVTAYIEFFRNTPGLAQLYFLFFGLGSWFHLSTIGPDGTPPAISPFAFVVIALSLHQGAFVAEVFRSSLQAIPKGILDSASALGYGRWQALWNVFLPLAMRSALPGIGNIAAQIVKGSALAYAIAVPEMLYVSHEIWSEHFNVIEMMNVVLVAYLALMGIVSAVLRLCEAWLRIPGYGQ